MQTPDSPGPPAQENVVRERYARTFAKNFVWLASSQIGGKLAGFVFVVVVARGLGAQQYGYFNFAASFVPLFLMFGAWGLEAAVIRGIARDPKLLSPLFASGLAARLSLGAVALLVSIGLAPLLVTGGEAFLTVVLVGSALLVDELTGFIGAVFKAHERMRFYARAIFVNRVVTTGLAVLALSVMKSLALVSSMYLLGSLLAFVVAWRALRAHFDPVSLRDARFPLARSLVGEGVPLGIAAVFNMALFRIDAVLLQALKGPIAVGMYGVAYRFLDSFLFAAWSLTSTAFPRIARLGASETTYRTYEFTLALLLAFYVPIATGSPFAAGWVVEAVFSDRYSPAADAVPWLTAAAVFYSVAYLSRIAAIGIGKRWAIAWVAGGAFALNVLLNIILIPRHSFRGAAVATCISEIFEAVLVGAVFWRALPGFRPSRLLAVPLVAGAAMGAVLWLTGARDALAVGLGAVTYAISLWLAARILAPDAARKVSAMLRRRRAPSAI